MAGIACPLICIPGIDSMNGCAARVCAGCAMLGAVGWLDAGFFAAGDARLGFGFEGFSIFGAPGICMLGMVMPLIGCAACAELAPAERINAEGIAIKASLKRKLMNFSDT
jgi:hypothetical protein